MIYNLNELLNKLGKKINNLTEQAGGLLGSCPFHLDKTPSFWIREDGYYKCFGCDKGGSIKKLLEELLIIEIPKNNYFAEKLQIEYSETTYFQLTKDIQKILIENIWDKKNSNYIEYLNKRGFSQEKIYKFKLGIANKVIDKLLNNGYSLEILKKFPLFKRIGKSLKFELEDNITFPIYDKQKNIIGFSGRNIFLKQYLNLTNNNIYKKSNSLYFIPNEELLNQKTTYIVEGYFDVLSLAKENLKSVALMGSSMSETQLKLIKQSKNEIILCLDNDLAGIKGNLKIAQVLSEQIKGVVLLNQYKDIDEHIKNKQPLNVISLEDYCMYYIQIYKDEIIPLLPEHILLKYLLSLIKDNNFTKLKLLEPLLRSRETYVYLNAQLKFENFIIQEIKKHTTIEELGINLTKISDINISECLLIKNDLIISDELLNDVVIFFNLYSLIIFQKTLQLIALKNEIEKDKDSLVKYFNYKKIIENCKEKLKKYYAINS